MAMTVKQYLCFGKSDIIFSVSQNRQRDLSDCIKTKVDYTTVLTLKHAHVHKPDLDNNGQIQRLM